MTQQLGCKIVGLGVWGAHFANKEALAATLGENDVGTSPEKGPKPDIIPPNERRRAPLTVRLAVEASWQATQMAGLSLDALKCVFASGLGDTDLTDYMCQVLASANKQLSPTKFHNSVHNAPAGYWTISTKNTGAANSVAGYQNSLSVTLLEALIQCQLEGTPVLVTLYDAPAASKLLPVLKNSSPFAASFLCCPLDSKLDGTTIHAAINYEPNSWPKLKTQNTYLNELYDLNCAAKALCLLEPLLAPHVKPSPLHLPLSEGTTLSITF